MKRDGLGQAVSRSSSTLARPALNLNYSLNLKHPASASRWNDVMVVMMPVDHTYLWPGASDQRATDNKLDCCLQVVSHLFLHSTVLGLRRRRYYIRTVRYPH